MFSQMIRLQIKNIIFVGCQLPLTENKTEKKKENTKNNEHLMNRSYSIFGFQLIAISIDKQCVRRIQFSKDLA